jgi:putative transcriptional regulator
MSLRKGLLFAMLFAIVALAESGRVNVSKAEFDVPKPNTLLRAPAPATAALPWYGSWPANKPSRWLKAFRRKGELLPASFLPIQFKNPKDLGIGKLLVASRGLGDPHFAGTVILLVHYDENGVVGLVLNRRTDVPLSQVLDLKAAKGRSDSVYIGGPMEPSAAFALFRSSAKIEKAENIFGSVYLISDKGLFEKTISDRPDANVFHVYLGYARWTQDQLRTEVQLGAWFVFPADAAVIFSSDPDSLWLQMIQKTELRLAKTEPFVESPSQSNCFDKSRVIHQADISHNASFRENHRQPVSYCLSNSSDKVSLVWREQSGRVG